MNYTDIYGVVYSEDRKTLLKCPVELGDCTVHEGTEVIGKSAFKDCISLKSLSLPSSIRTIENDAFSGCNHLASLQYGGTINGWLQIDWNSWIECGHSISIDGNVLQNLIVPEGVEIIKRYAFYYCTSLKSVTFSSSIKTIEESAFNKSNITGALFLPDSLVTIFRLAFFACINITSVYIPRDTETIWYGAFGDCTKLSSFAISEDNPRFKTAQDGHLLYSVKDSSLKAVAVNKAYEIVIPKEISSISADTFCYDQFPSGGVYIKHQISKIVPGAFLKCKDGSYVYVPVNLLTYYYRLGVPSKMLRPYFDIHTAFIPGQEYHLPALIDNPYRVLGLYADATPKEIVANGRKIKRYNEVGKDIEFPVDQEVNLPKVSRTNEDVDRAIEQLSTDKGRLSYALFWSYITPKKLTFDFGDSDIRISFSHTYKSVLSESLLHFTEGEYYSAFWLTCANIFDNFKWNEWLEAAGVEKGSINQDSVISNYVNLWLEGIKIEVLYGMVLKVAPRNMPALLKSYLEDKIRKRYQDALNTSIQEAHSVDSHDSIASYKAAESLYKSGREILELYEIFFGEEDTEYRLIADKFANQLLQCGINFYNSSNDPYDAEKAVKIAEQALDFAKGKVRVDRCKQNLDILRRNAESLPPKEIKDDESALSKLIEVHSETEESIAQAYIILRDSVQYLCHIKECIESCSDRAKKEKMNNVLLEQSTNIVAMALNKLVAEVNDATKSNLKAANTIRRAREVMFSMDNFPMLKEFKDGRYKSNKDTLNRLFIRTLSQSEWGLSDLASYPKSYPLLKIQTEEEAWMACKVISDYQRYIEIFKPSKHETQAKAAIARLKAEAERQDDEAYGKCNDEDGLKEYLSKYSNGRHKSEAEERLKELKSTSVQTGVWLWLMIAFILTIALTGLYVFVPEEVFIGCTVGGVFAYLIGLLIYVGIKTQGEKKPKVTSKTYRSDDYSFAYGAIAFTLVEVLTFLICYLIWRNDGEGTWIIVGLGMSVTLWVIRVHYLLYLWFKELIGDLHLKIIKKREKNK